MLNPLRQASRLAPLATQGGCVQEDRQVEAVQHPAPRGRPIRVAIVGQILAAKGVQGGVAGGAIS